jgi:ribosomal protein S12 methylthiotransferase accessory factor
VVVVDRTTDELRRAGLTAVAAIIPDLQPMTLHPLARYLGHPRLYSAPLAMGYRSLREEEINPWPQPFA